MGNQALQVGMDSPPSTLYAKKVATSETAYPVLIDAFGNLLVTSGLVPPGWDYVSLTPASQPTTVVFKSGGSGGTTLSTLTIAYSGSDISSVTRT